MKKGFGLVPVLIGVGVLVVLGAGIVAAYNISNNNRSIDQVGSSKDTDSNFGFLDKLEETLTNKPNDAVQPIPVATPTPAPSPTPAPQSNSTGGGSTTSSTYTQPQGIYAITLPPGWVVGSTFATTTYSTTTFNGPHGNIQITFGTGNDPLGGCSEASAVVLADRTVSGCYLLQKNGSRILTRTYTTTSGNLPITIQAYINPPLATNQPIVTSIIGTIDIR